MKGRRLGRRQLNHERVITYRSFECDNGHFDIEAHLKDSKGYNYTDRERGVLPPGAPVHDVFAVLTLDEEMIVRDFRYELRAVPFAYCQGAVDPERLLGASIRQGWRNSLQEVFGPQGGCTHLKELTFGMGTVAFQTISATRDERMFAAGKTDADRAQRPFFLGKCRAWVVDGPIVKAYMPQFHQTRQPGDD